MLTVSELGEALEALRHCKETVFDVKDDKLPERSGVGCELADAVIRIMDHAEGRGIPLWDIIHEKHAFNKTRPRKHGKEF